MRLSILLTSLLFAPAILATELTALVYHDIVPDPVTDDYAVSVTAFHKQLDTLHRLGYQPISLKTLDDVVRGRASLPKKPVLITFDDGLASFKRYALPELEKRQYPAVLSIESGWLDGLNVPESYRGRLLTWQDVRQVLQSHLVEIASHTHNLHHGIQSNSQVNLAPASITRRYDPKTKTYEGETAFRIRIRQDIKQFTQRLKVETHTKANAMTWPYGHYDSVLVEEAQAQGLYWQLTLGLLPARTEEFPVVSRLLVYRARNLADFERLLLQPPGVSAHRILEVQLDAWNELTDVEREEQLSILLNRLEQLRINTVMISPFTREGRFAFFSNPGVPSKGDFLNRVLHQMRTRSGIQTIILRFPEKFFNASVYTELARRHPYDAILINSAMDPEGAAVIQKQFTYYRPNLSCGSEGRVSRPSCQDFIMEFVTPGQQAQNRDDLKSNIPVYALLQNDPTLSGTQLITSVRALDQNGVRHYGLRFSAALDDIATLTGVAVELANLTNRGH